MDSAGSKTCARMVLDEKGKPSGKQLIYVMGIWFSDHFSLSVSDGLHAWTCLASKEIVADRASQWDVSIRDFIKDANFYLSHQQPGSVYTFTSVGDSQMRLSWTLERNGTKLEGRWKLEKAEDASHIIHDILDFLMDANIKLSEEVVRKSYAFDKMKSEAEKCLAQSQRFVDDKTRFEEEIYRKFVAILNSKKAKLRELRDALARNAPVAKKEPEDEDELDVDTDNEDSMDQTGEDREFQRGNAKPQSDFERIDDIVKGKDTLEKHDDIKVSNEKNDDIHPKDEVDSDATQPFEDMDSTARPNDDTATSGVKVKSEALDDVATSGVKVKSEALDDVAAGILRTSTHARAPRKRHLI